MKSLPGRRRCQVPSGSPSPLGAIAVLIQLACGTTKNGPPSPPADGREIPGRPAGDVSLRALAAHGPSAKPPHGPLLMVAADVDTVVATSWKTAHVTPVGVSDDSEFLRRIMLDLAGRIPTLEEAERFLADGAVDKRVRLVDGVLGSADYAEHSADLCVDLFIGRQFRKPHLEKRLDPRGYFVTAFRENRPFDRIAREMLTFTGEIQPNGPGLFLASHLKGGGPEMVAAATARLFAGVQISCAQCHDHPTDLRYKQEDFFALVAYFGGTKSREEKRGAERESPGGAAGVAPADPRRVAEAPAGAGGGSGGPTVPLPTAPGPPTVSDVGMASAATADAPEKNRSTAKAMSADKSYFILEKGNPWPAKFKKAKFKKVGADEETAVSPRFLGRDVAPLPGETPRDTLARAVVESELFAKAMVNRTWARFFGRGIMEPWDDLGGEGDARHPALLNALAKDFRESGFDVKHLVRTIVLSRAYGLTSRVPAAVVAQVEAVATAPADGGGAPPPVSPPPVPPSPPTSSAFAAFDATSVFARASVRRMTPEQLFRSILVATGADHMERAGTEDREKKMERLMREHLFVFGDDEMAEVDTFNGNIPQALLMFNGEIVNQGARSRSGGTLAAILARASDPALRLHLMFMAAYGRPPTPTERDKLLPLVTANGTKGPALFEDLFFALLTSTEMQTIH